MRVLAVAILVVGVTPAGADEPGATSGALSFFEAKIRPLLSKHCHSCHSAQAKKQKGGLLLDSRTALLKGGDSGPAVVPGEPDKSLLIQAVRYDQDRLQMPPRGKLSAGEILLLETWVRRGAVYPSPVTTAARTEGIDLAKGRQFWSFQPARVAPLPVVRDRVWPQFRIDTFVLAELESRGLTPSQPADRRILIRRASFDLIGLPPSPEEVESFVNDSRPDAYDRLIDRLLASPHHGERWARYWLDLARYCDVGESWVSVKGQSWLYRDWVVQALNQGLPYDRFVRLQLAADQVPGATPPDRAALGFLGLSPDYWKELMLDKEVIKAAVADEWEERLDALGRTFLGLTIACARCHDHKFDPIRTQDYYALAGVLASIRQADLSLLPDDEARQVEKAHAQVEALQRQIKKLTAAKPPDAEQIARLQSESEEIRKATPHFSDPPARGVVDASLQVLADGPHRTRLHYQPGVAQDIAMQIRGNPSNPGPIVPRRFLAVLSPDPPPPFTHGSGRLDLAEAIVTQAAPLSARVIVNRVWFHHFGRGLVETLSDFGSQGARPSHPRLLDDLTARFIQNGWSLKWLHREIMRSATYRQSSAHDPRKHAIDPDNHWLWRANRRRLEVEAWRDAMLTVTGTLRREVGGPPVSLDDAANCRRTLYGTVKRRELHELLRLHDFPDPVGHSAGRLPTTTALQQLFTLNSPMLRQQATALVKRLRSDAADDAARVDRAYRLLFGRPPTTREVQRARAFLGGGKPGGSSTDETWAQYAQVLLGSNEFLFVD